MKAEAVEHYKKIKDNEVEKILIEFGDKLDERVVNFLKLKHYWKQVDGDCQFKVISNKYLAKEE